MVESLNTHIHRFISLSKMASETFLTFPIILLYYIKGKCVIIYVNLC